MIESLTMGLTMGIIGCLTGFLGLYIASKTILKTDRILEISEDVIDNTLSNIISDVEMQKQVYSVGVLLGNGLKTGLGITGKGGKFKLENVIGEGIGMFIQQFLQSRSQGQPTASNPQDKAKLGEPFK